MRRTFPLLLVLTLVACTPNLKEESASTSSMPQSSLAESSLPAESTSGTSSHSPEAAFAPAEFSLQSAFPHLSFEQPLFLTYAPGESDALYVVERTGRIYRIQRGQTASEKELFLDLSETVQARGQEQGLLGLAFHPDYAQNRFFYVNYTAQDQTFVSRFLGKEDGTADPDSETVVLQFDQPFANHNGGQLDFGPDGYLYIATGDGGSGGDPHDNAQNKKNLLGKILRIDVSQDPYAVPEDNPFAGEEGAAGEIYAYGLRNPWRFSFDRETGELWAADVGQNAWEEINLIESGGNYGWNRFEGTHPYQAPSEEESGAFLPPIHEYGHSQGQSITGGYVYRGSAYPELRGQYIYGDFVTGRVWALERHEDGTVTNQPFLESDLQLSSFGLDQEGELFLVDFKGGIYQLTK